jgi:hypothetical protein
VCAALLTGPVGLDAIPATVLASAAAWLTITALDHRRDVDRPGGAGPRS